jgi:hypothetical protein
MFTCFGKVNANRMNTFPRHWSQFKISSGLSQGLVVLALSMGGLLIGAVPSISLSSGLEFGISSAAAQTSVSNTELTNYARSLLEIEPMRQNAYAEIQRIVGAGNVPSIACHRPQSVDGLPGNIRPIARTYCDRAIAVVESHNLTIQRFNEITVFLSQQGSNSDLHQRLERELIRLQQ